MNLTKKAMLSFYLEFTFIREKLYINMFGSLNACLSNIITYFFQLFEIFEFKTLCKGLFKRICKNHKRL